MPGVSRKNKRSKLRGLIRYDPITKLSFLVGPHSDLAGTHFIPVTSLDHKNLDRLYRHYVKEKYPLVSLRVDTDNSTLTKSAFFLSAPAES